MSDWLADPTHPSLDTPIADRLNDATLPDRLTWNAFRTLAQWNTDVWVPGLLEVALGADNNFSGLDWAEATVEVWRIGAGQLRDPRVLGYGAPSCPDLPVTRVV